MLDAQVPGGLGELPDLVKRERVFDGAAVTYVRRAFSPWERTGRGLMVLSTESGGSGLLRAQATTCHESGAIIRSPHGEPSPRIVRGFPIRVGCLDRRETRS